MSFQVNNSSLKKTNEYGNTDAFQSNFSNAPNSIESQAVADKISNSHSSSFSSLEKINEKSKSVFIFPDDKNLSGLLLNAYQDLLELREKLNRLRDSYQEQCFELTGKSGVGKLAEEKIIPIDVTPRGSLEEVEASLARLYAKLAPEIVESSKTVKAILQEEQFKMTSTLPKKYAKARGALAYSHDEVIGLSTIVKHLIEPFHSFKKTLKAFNDLEKSIGEMHKSALEEIDKKNQIQDPYSDETAAKAGLGALKEKAEALQSSVDKCIQLLTKTTSELRSAIVTNRFDPYVEYVEPLVAPTYREKMLWWTNIRADLEESNARKAALLERIKGVWGQTCDAIDSFVRDFNRLHLAATSKNGKVPEIEPANGVFGKLKQALGGKKNSYVNLSMPRELPNGIKV